MGGSTLGQCSDTANGNPHLKAIIAGRTIDHLCKAQKQQSSSLCKLPVGVTAFQVMTFRNKQNKRN